MHPAGRPCTQAHALDLNKGFWRESEQSLAMFALGVGKESGGLLRGPRVFVNSTQKSLVNSFGVSSRALRLKDLDDRSKALVTIKGQMVERFHARLTSLRSVCVLLLGLMQETEQS